MSGPAADGLRTFDALATGRRRWLAVFIPLLVVATVATIVLLDTVVFRTEGPEDRSRFGLAVVIALVGVALPMVLVARRIARRRAARMEAAAGAAAGGDLSALTARAEAAFDEVMTPLGRPATEGPPPGLSPHADLEAPALERALTGGQRPTPDAVFDVTDLRLERVRIQAADLGPADGAAPWFVAEYRWWGARRVRVPSTGEVVDLREERFFRQARMLLTQDDDGVFRPARVRHVLS